MPGVIQQIMEGAPAWARIVVVGACMEVDRFEPFFGIAKQLNLQFVLGYMQRHGGKLAQAFGDALQLLL